jgi:hypothetical protein
MTPTATSFPLSKHTGGGDTTPAISGRLVFTVNMGSGPSPLSCGVFLALPLLQAFPLLVAGCVLPLLPSLADLFIYSSLGKWAFLPLLWSFPPTTTLTSFPTPRCCTGATTPVFSSQLLYYNSVRDFPSPLWCSGHPTLFATCLFFVVAYYSFFFFFPWVGVGLCRGLC